MEDEPDVLSDQSDGGPNSRKPWRKCHLCGDKIKSQAICPSCGHTRCRRCRRVIPDDDKRGSVKNSPFVIADQIAKAKLAEPQTSTPIIQAESVSKVPQSTPSSNIPSETKPHSQSDIKPSLNPPGSSDRDRKRDDEPGGKPLPKPPTPYAQSITSSTGSKDPVEPEPEGFINRHSAPSIRSPRTRSNATKQETANWTTIQVSPTPSPTPASNELSRVIRQVKVLAREPGSGTLEPVLQVDMEGLRGKDNGHGGVVRVPRVRVSSPPAWLKNPSTQPGSIQGRLRHIEVTTTPGGSISRPNVSPRREPPPPQQQPRLHRKPEVEDFQLHLSRRRVGTASKPTPGEPPAVTLDDHKHETTPTKPPTPSQLKGPMPSPPASTTTTRRTTATTTSGVTAAIANARATATAAANTAKLRNDGVPPPPPPPPPPLPLLRPSQTSTTTGSSNHGRNHDKRRQSYYRDWLDDMQRQRHEQPFPYQDMEEGQSKSASSTVRGRGRPAASSGRGRTSRGSDLSSLLRQSQSSSLFRESTRASLSSRRESDIRRARSHGVLRYGSGGGVLGGEEDRWVGYGLGGAAAGVQDKHWKGNGDEGLEEQEGEDEEDDDDVGIRGLTIVLHLRGKDDLVISTDLTREAGGEEGDGVEY